MLHRHRWRPVTDKHVLGPDIDLDVEVVRDKKGRRITEARAERLAEQVSITDTRETRCGQGQTAMTATTVT
jgi:hypothetical protein